MSSRFALLLVLNSTMILPRVVAVLWILRATQMENGHARVLVERTIRGTADLCKFSTLNRCPRGLDAAFARPIRFRAASFVVPEMIGQQRVVLACCAQPGLRNSTPSVITLILRVTLKFCCFL